MPKICIFGDSWGCGEWAVDENNQHRAVHKGLEQYLINDGFEVDNFSKGGCNNLNRFNTVKHLNFSKYDFVFCFQTDPLRDYVPYDNCLDIFKSVDSLRNANKKQLIAHYQRLDSLNTPIYLLGGACKVNQIDLANYKNLHVFVSSIMEFLCPHTIHPEIWISTWVDLLNKKNCSMEVLDYLHKQKFLRDKLFDIDDFLIKKYFDPDGQHANRIGHLMLYQKFKKELLL